MTKPPWILEEGRAILQTERLRGVVRRSAPWQGISELDWNHVAQSGTLLGIAFPGSTCPSVEEIEDLYVRGSDLVVTYAEVPRRPYRTRIDWRFPSPAPQPATGPAGTVLDLVLSAQTSRLDQPLDLGVSFSLPAGHAIAPVVGSESPAGDRTGRPGGVSDTALSCCSVATLGPGQPRVAMIVHPEDFRGVQIEPGTTEGHPTVVTFPIFGHRIEKGVIVRARARCVLFAPETDQTGTDQAALLAWPSDL